MPERRNRDNNNLLLHTYIHTIHWHTVHTNPSFLPFILLTLKKKKTFLFLGLLSLSFSKNVMPIICNYLLQQLFG